VRRFFGEPLLPMCYKRGRVRWIEKGRCFPLPGFIHHIFCLIGFAVSGDILAVDKPVVGAIEHVIIEPFGVRVDAGIDTGASATSLDALGISKYQKTR
jgi:hypothetical protein